MTARISLIPEKTGGHRPDLFKIEIGHGAETQDQLALQRWDWSIGVVRPFPSFSRRGGRDH
jgi:hypothetical protein